MDDLAEEFRAAGDVVRERQYRQIYRAVIDLLDQIYDLAGGEMISARDYLELLEAGFSQIRLGTIPQRVDRILVGDIERTRLTQIRHLFFAEYSYEALGRIREADRLYDLLSYASIAETVTLTALYGALCALLDRVFYSLGGALKGKPACAVVNCRRGGASAAFDRLNKYITYNQGFVVTGTYWNSTHGRKPEDVEQDLEGLQVMRVLGHNMATALRSETPDGLREKRVMTDYIR
jgi:hypothetical protein